MGRAELFLILKDKDGGTVTFGDNNKGKIIDIDNIGNFDKPSIENVLLVDGLKHNLLSISQLCDKGYKVCFKHDTCLIIDSNNSEVIFKGIRNHNVYELYLDKLVFNEHCLLASNENSHL